MKHLLRATFLYLLLPIPLFFMGWLRPEAAIPLIGIVLWAMWGIWKGADAFTDSIPPRMTAKAALLVCGWVLLSGIGGYAFQNYDFHGRNAILRDLIEYAWPVTYAEPGQGPVRMLVYYFGYWLPAALAGKIFGWQAANAFLFIWTCLGAMLAILHLGALTKASAVKAALLLAGFSGLDALGTLFFAREYPRLWPPVQHLEVWSGILQFSSFTTQLFWVFNQAVPAWLCAALFMTLGPARAAAHDARGLTFLAWALCFFFAPLASIGLFPFLLVDWIAWMRLNSRAPLRGIRLDRVLAGMCIALAAYLFYSSNTAARDRGLLSLPWVEAVRFVLLEAGLFWLPLAFVRRRDPRWIIAGLLFAAVPFIQVGGERDFVMRASIAPLFHLMAWCGAAAFAQDTPRGIRAALTAALLIGCLTPLYEINRSIHRTYEYYFVLEQSERLQSDPAPAARLEQGGAPESEHPGTLAADGIRTLASLEGRLAENYLANVRKSPYYRWIAPR
jgi:hypothetical protein